MPSRGAIGQALRQAWTQADRDAYRTAVGGKALEGGQFAKCLQDLMKAGKAGKDAYRQCAEQAGIAKKLHDVWTP